MKVLISNIQRFSLHDGPGIRTTLFLMGCSLRCPWCCNPENLEYKRKEYTTSDGYKGIYGNFYDCNELEKIILKDKQYYKQDGGVTYSGGEALLQARALEPLMHSLKENEISQVMETSLFAPRENLEIVIKYIDLFYVDLKDVSNNNNCKNNLHGDLELFLDNLDFLFKNNCKVVFRTPLVASITNTDENIYSINRILSKYTPIRYEVFLLHNLGEAKYRSLGYTYKAFEQISEEEVDDFISKIKSNCEIKKITI